MYIILTMQMSTHAHTMQEQQAVVDHVKGELFPMIGVNTKILKAEGLQSSTPGKNHPNPYCVVAIETEGSVCMKSTNKIILHPSRHHNKDRVRKLCFRLARRSGNSRPSLQKTDSADFCDGVKCFSLLRNEGFSCTA